MQYTITQIFIKAIYILLFIIIFYIITNNIFDINYNSKSQFETFEDSIEKEKINYLKLNETFIEPNIESEDKLSLDLLYANYSGENVRDTIWKTKTLDQCTDICNKLEGCIGFTRESVLDTEPSDCYPHNKINKSYSNRKGNLNQMQKAVKHNSFIKSNVPNVLNLCIGDSDLTLNRPIFIKSYKYPNTFLGVNGDSRVVLVDINSNNLNSACNFRIESGQDGVGTVSFCHINTNKYLYRDISNNIILKNLSKNNKGQTENKQRSSFNIYDSKISSDTIMLKSMVIDGETTEKFITLDGNYLNVSHLSNDNTNDKSDDKSTFYIVDAIINTNIIINKQNIPDLKPSVEIIPNTIEQENFTVNLDTSNNIGLYNTLFNPPDKMKLSVYLENNYLDNQPKYMSIYNKQNDNIINKQLTDSITKYEKEYNSNRELNLEIEKEISNLNLDLNAKNDKIINGLDKMRISDMANDYFFLQNITKNNTKPNT